MVLYFILVADGVVMFSLNTLSIFILTKNLPSNFEEFSLVYLYIFTTVPSSIFVGAEPSSVIKLTSSPSFLSNLTLYVATPIAAPTTPSI